MSTTEFRPLWQIMLSLKNGELTRLTCADCFTVLEYLADTMGSMTAHRLMLLQKIRQHLETCPDCRTYYLEKLAELESLSGD